MIRFLKYEGLGNDFLLFDGRLKGFPESLSSPSISWIKSICDRHFGVGGDGLIFVLPAEKDGDVRMRIYNSDGTEAEMCGNGIRCIIRYLFDSQTPKGQNEWKIETLAGIIKSKTDSNGNIEVDMGKPVFKPSEIPTTMPIGKYGLAQGNIVIDNLNLEVFSVGMGNPHVIIPIKDLHNIEFEKLGKFIEIHPYFPSYTNVHFVEIVSKQSIKLLVWERGCGPTLACGTGACASLVAANMLGLCDEKANVKLPGGNLTVNWPNNRSSVFMAGPARFIYEGNISYT